MFILELEDLRWSY